MEVCTDNNSLFTHPPNYASEAECMTACDAMGSEEDILPGIPVTTQHFGYGNTSLCRIHHLHAAVYQSHPDLHCNHASQSSTADTCVDSAPPNTVNYCAFVTTFCTEYIASTDSQTACTPAVDPLVGDVYLEAGHASFADTDRKTVGCLNYWAMKAPLDPATYCPMADWDPDHWDINSGAGKCSQ